MKAACKTFLTIVLLACALPGCEQPPAARPLTPSEQLELQTLTGQIADATRSTKTRREAAELLLNRPHPQAAEALRGLLADSTNTTAQVAVAEAIELRGGGQDMFIQPLLEMLTGEEPSVRNAAGRALAAYKDAEVTDKLIAIAADKDSPNDVRLVAIRSLELILDERVLEAMVELLDDPDRQVRSAAGESLAKLTSIRTFGADPAAWKRWWAANKDKDRSEWLADLAESLGKAKASLDAENTQLRDRLARTMQDLYGATPAAEREAMLLSLLKDPLADVRVVATTLTYRKLAANEPVSKNVRAQIRALLGDADARVRRASAVLLGNLGDVEVTENLLERLKAEQDPVVRQGLLTAMGQLRDPKALPAVLAEIPSGDETISAAAAAALARIVETHPLSDELKDQAAAALIDRYELAVTAAGGAELREALLTAMGTIGRKAFTEVLRGALRDKAATVRMAAVDALAKLGDSDSAEMIEPLVGDDDRGVRQAAVAAMAALGGKQHLQSVFRRTDPSVEPDAAVRRQAWQTTMALLTKADPDAIRAVADSLTGRPDAANQRIQVLQMLVGAVAADKGRPEADARRQLGLALIQAGRPAEATAHLGEAYKIYSKVQPLLARSVWSEWVGVLLASDDPAVVKAMNEQVDDEYFAVALEQLTARLSGLKAKGEHSAVIRLARAVVKDLPHRLTAEQNQSMEKFLADALDSRRAEERQEVAKLIDQLLSNDEAVGKAATTQLQAMGERAVRPLLEELKQRLSAKHAEGAEAADSQAEAAIVAALAQVAPGLTGYDPAAPKADKLKLLETWLESQP